MPPRVSFAEPFRLSWTAIALSSRSANRTLIFRGHYEGDISSTYQDLVDHRAAVDRTLRRMGHDAWSST